MPLKGAVYRQLCTPCSSTGIPSSRNCAEVVQHAEVQTQTRTHRPYRSMLQRGALHRGYQLTNLQQQTSGKSQNKQYAAMAARYATAASILRGMAQLLPQLLPQPQHAHCQHTPGKGVGNRIGRRSLARCCYARVCSTGNSQHEFWHGNGGRAPPKALTPRTTGRVTPERRAPVTSYTRLFRRNSYEASSPPTPTCRCTRQSDVTQSSSGPSASTTHCPR